MPPGAAFEEALPASCVEVNRCGIPSVAEGCCPRCGIAHLWMHRGNVANSVAIRCAKAVRYGMPCPVG